MGERIARCSKCSREAPIYFSDCPLFVQLTTLLNAFYNQEVGSTNAKISYDQLMSEAGNVGCLQSPVMKNLVFSDNAKKRKRN